MQIEEYYLHTILFAHFGKFPYILFLIVFITINVFNHFKEYINANFKNGNVSDSKN